MEKARWSSADWLRLTIAIGSFGLFAAGGWLMYLGITADGLVDVKTSLASGTLKTGSAGLFMCFFAFLMIVFCLITVPSKSDETPVVHSRSRKLIPILAFSAVGFLVCVIASALVSPDLRSPFSIGMGLFGSTAGSLVFAVIRLVSTE